MLLLLGGNLQAWSALLLRDLPQWKPAREETEKKSDCMDAQAQRILAGKRGKWYSRVIFTVCCIWTLCSIKSPPRRNVFWGGWWREGIFLSQRTVLDSEVCRKSYITDLHHKPLLDWLAIVEAKIHCCSMNYPQLNYRKEWSICIYKIFAGLILHWWTESLTAGNSQNSQGAHFQSAHLVSYLVYHWLILA